MTNGMCFIQLNECVAMMCVTCLVLMLTGLSMKTEGLTWAVFCVRVTCVVLMLTGLSMKTGGHTWAVFCVCYNMCCVDADRSEYEDWRPHLGSLLCVLYVLC